MVRYIGAHPSIKKNILNTVYYIQEINGNALQIFYGSPRSSGVKKGIKTFNKKETDSIKQYVQENDIYLVIHAPYTMNFVKPITSGTKKYLNRLINELDFAHEIGAVGSVLHYGSLTKYPPKKGLKMFADSIKYVLERTKHDDVYLILETSSGAGSLIGKTIEEMKEIEDLLGKYKNRIRYCIDTAHIFSAGYPINTEKGVKQYFRKFNKLIGLDKVELIQLNDSKVPLGGNVDRHENLLKGYIFDPKKGGSKDALIQVLKEANKHNLPIILETHKDYDKEIELLHNLIHKYVNKNTSRLPRKTETVESNIVCTSFSEKSNQKNKKMAKGGSKNVAYVKVIGILKQFAAIYRAKGDIYRQRAYTRAIQAIKKMDPPLKSIKDIDRVCELEGIGEGLCGKIGEIMKTGKSAKLNKILRNKTVSAKADLMTVDGIGPVHAKKLVKEGICSVSNLKKKMSKENGLDLTNRQRLGIKYYDDLRVPIKRGEIKKFGTVLEKVAKKCDPSMKITLAGSYKYGMKESGDIDVILTHKDIVKRGDIRKSRDILGKFIDCLHGAGLIEADIEQGLTKYSGIVKLSTFTHIDIRLAPKESLGAFMLYFAAGTDYSQMLRQKAKAKGLRLSEWGLYDIKRKKWLPLTTESAIRKMILK